jgi:hypothetical protein
MNKKEAHPGTNQSGHSTTEAYISYQLGGSPAIATGGGSRGEWAR